MPWQREENFELLVADTPQELETCLRARQEAGHTARMTAGSCWPWSSPPGDGSLVDDMVIGEWRRPWMLLTRGLAGTVLYATDPETHAMLRALIPGRATQRT
ncbi:hypothetical protein T261_3080 [Streptomyces lydicus]|nr:hypothetical protein T261_3080 [Streptomyces lydicus]